MTQTASEPGRAGQHSEEDGWRSHAAWLLSEARGAVSLSLILAVALSVFGLARGSHQWISLVGIPIWMLLRKAKLV